MEIKVSVPWLDKSHPNYTRWERGRNLSIERGKFVRALISGSYNLTDKKILDLGSGEGGTSFLLSQNNFLISSDYSSIRLRRQRDNFNQSNSFLVNNDAKHLPFPDNSFDIIILQDVIEHIDDTEKLIAETNRVLKSGGLIYLSTPNRFSVFNIISDPHWGLPLLSLFKRQFIRNFYLKIFRKDEMNRTDIAELLSLKELSRYFNGDCELNLYTNFAVRELLKGNKGIVWSNFHLKLLKLVSFVHFDRIILSAANNKSGFINKYFTPTYYILLKKL